METLHAIFVAAIGWFWILSIFSFDCANAHGYVWSPRSREFVAHTSQEGKWSPTGTSADQYYPIAENCPHCANRQQIINGTIGRCGLSSSGYNYDYPLNVLGGPLPPKIQATYVKGQQIDLSVILTAHHKGHFTYSACALKAGETTATQQCFDSNPLIFVQDNLYGAPKDNRYPDRAYIPLTTFPGIQQGGDPFGYKFSHRFQLPAGLSGDRVLIQWHYWTANSCIYPGYRTLTWPAYFFDQSSLADCTSIPLDGNGIPEQFWNCAEVTVLDSPLVVAPAAPTKSSLTAAPAPILVPTATPAQNKPAFSPAFTPPTVSVAGTCGNANRGNGLCPDPSLCCSQWGYCGTGPSYCTTPAPVSQPMSVPIAPSPPTSSAVAGDDSRLVAYLGNWQSCPTTAQVAKYTHILVAFAVTYTWAPAKNVCDTSCTIGTPVPICNNAPQPSLVAAWKASGKKIILSFGGAGMGGSWSGDVNNCWDYCFGKEDSVISQLTQIVQNQGFDGVDIDYEYFYSTAQQQNFISKVTTGLRTALPPGSIVSHAPMDSDLVPGKAYYEVLRSVSASLSFIMPQYYNGITRPVLDGIIGTGSGSVSALSHYTNLVNNMFGGDATKVTFGFCISDCSGTNSNANAQQAVKVMTDLKSYYACNGGAMFWVAENDNSGSWSVPVSAAVQPSASCSIKPSPIASPVFAPSGQVAKPIVKPVGTAAPAFKPVVVPAATPIVAPFSQPSKPLAAPAAKPVAAPVAPPKKPIKSPMMAPVKGPIRSPVVAKPITVTSPATVVGTCGSGSIGNGICSDKTLCCSQYGYCGTGSAYCRAPSRPAASPPTVTGTCGNGSIGNGICADKTLCCSQYGYCGTGSAWCGSPTRPR